MLLVSADGVPDVPLEARAFLGAVAAFVVFLFVLFLYLNKRLCFYTVGNLPCCDEVKPKKLANELGIAYNYDEGDTSSDSEDNASKKLTSSKGYQKAEREQYYHSQSSNQPCQGCNHNYHQLEPSRSSSRYSNKNEASRLEKAEKSPKPSHNDLMSLAEKGRVGMDEIASNAAASSSSSSSGSTTSGDDEFMTHRTLRHRDPRTYRHLTSTTVGSPYHIDLQQDDLNGISEEALLIRCGSLEVGFCYDLPTKTLTVHVLQAKDVPPKERGGTANSQVRLHVLPGRKQKQRTKVRTGENPQFNEAFVFNKINPEDVQQLGIRLRLCGCERMRRERIIGEAIVPLSSVSMGMGNTTWLNLEPRAVTTLQHLEERAEIGSLTRSDSIGSNGSTHSVHGGLPEILIGLSYNGTTGRLAVEVIKGSHFRNTDEYRNLNLSRAPDSYVKLSLTSSSGQEIACSKTSVRRGQPNPLYKETFMFQVALFQLHDVTLMISVYAKRSIKRKDALGWFALGLNSSGEEELSHWNAMRDSKGEQICRWHVLLDS